MVVRSFYDLRSSYLLNESIVIANLSDDVQRVIVLSAIGAVYEEVQHAGTATFTNLPVGTHVVQAVSSSGSILDEEFFSVRSHRGEDPIPGFVTSFDDASRDDVLAWLRELDGAFCVGELRRSPGTANLATLAGKPDNGH
jgi:hypothetical protein